MSDAEKPLKIELLDSNRANMLVSRLVELANLIPQVEYQAEDVTRVEKHDGRKMHEKWKHSYTAEIDGEVMGLLMAYRRDAEGGELYPSDSFYLSEIAIDPKAQGKGIARQLLRKYHEDCLGEAEELGIGFSVQTNSADWNSSVVSLYESLGYKIVGYKDYDNRTDVVMRATTSDIRANIGENLSN